MGAREASVGAGEVDMGAEDVIVVGASGVFGAAVPAGETVEGTSEGATKIGASDGGIVGAIVEGAGVGAVLVFNMSATKSVSPLLGCPQDPLVQPATSTLPSDPPTMVVKSSSSPEPACHDSKERVHVTVDTVYH